MGETGRDKDREREREKASLVNPFRPCVNNKIRLVEFLFSGPFYFLGWTFVFSNGDPRPVPMPE